MYSKLLISWGKVVFWDVGSCSAIQETSYLKVHYRTDNISLIYPILSHLNPIQTNMSY